MAGATLFEGIVMVIGEGRFSRAGGATIEGAMILADIAGPDDVYGTADDCKSGFEQGNFSTAGGGPNEMGFCSTNIVVPQGLYRITQFLQR